MSRPSETSAPARSRSRLSPARRTATLAAIDALLPLAAALAATPVRASTPTFADGFESGSYSAWTAARTSSGGVAVVQSRVVRSGAYASQLSESSQKSSTAYVRKTLATSLSDATVSLDVDVTAEGAVGSSVPIVRLYSSSGAWMVTLYRQNQTQGQVWILDQSTYRQTTARLALGTWAHVDFHVKPNGAASTIEAYVNGTLAYSTTTGSLGTSPLGSLVIGNSVGGQAFAEYVDNVSVVAGPPATSPSPTASPVATPSPTAAPAATPSPVATPSPTTAPTRTPASLLVSMSSDRSNPSSLAGASLSGSVYIFAPSGTDTTGADFYLDGTLFHHEGLAPYDFVGTANSNTSSTDPALAWDTTTVAAGGHTISETTYYSDGTSAASSASFSIGGLAPAATAAPTASPSPAPTLAPTPAPTLAATPAPTASPSNPWSVPFLSRPAHGQIHLSNCSNVTVSGYSFSNIADDAIIIEGCNNVTVTANDFSGDVGAIYVLNSTNVTITWNRYQNIGDGTIGSGHSNFVQFNNSWGGYIGHNKGVGGNTEDIISIYQSGGASSTSPLVIEYNAFQGTNWTSGSGSGSMLGDAGGSHIVVRYNTYLSPGQVGIGIPSGTDIHITNNTLYGATRPLSNVGIYVWNQATTPCSGIEIANNQVKWYRSDGVENPYWNAGNCGTVSGESTNNWHASIDPTTLQVTL